MIEVKNLKKVYSKKVIALDNISFKLEKGEMLGVIGRNGAGKSTLFKIICGLIEDYEGESKIFSHKSSIEFAEHISYLPEVRGLDCKLYVLDHLTELLRYKGYSKKEAECKIIDKLKEFDLYKYRYRKISDLSKGNQQKLQFILAIANEPDILILDEPFSGLDLITTDFLWDMLISMKKRGCTIIFSTHNLSSNLERCDKFLLMNAGKMCAYGALESIQEKFSMILELKNKTITKVALENVISTNCIKENNDEFYIKIKDEEEARKIFNILEDKFSEKFYVRKSSLSEIFRQLCGEQYDNKSKS